MAGTEAIDQQSSSGTRSVRAKKGRRPFFIIEKDCAQMILDRVEGTDAAFSLATVLGLRWLANDARQPNGPVAATVAQIAHRSGLSYNTAAKALTILEALGVIHVRREVVAGTKAHAPSIFTFTPLRATVPPNTGDTFPTATPPRRAERYKKNTKEKKEREDSPSNASLVLTEAEVADARVELGLTEEQIRTGLGAFNQIKAAWPNDPRDLSAFMGALRSDKRVRSAIGRTANGRNSHSNLQDYSGAETKAPVSIPEPDNWRHQMPADDEDDVLRSRPWGDIPGFYQRRIALKAGRDWSERNATNPAA